MNKFLKIFLIIIAILIYITSVFEITSVMPRNAIVAVDDTKKLYYAPIFDCLYKADQNSLRFITAEKAYMLNYEPEPECRDSNGFIQDQKILFLLLDKYIFKKSSSRWNPDGSWNW